jgi:hypothetical protein
VTWSRFRILTVGVRGLMGVAGREWRRYHANTVELVSSRDGLVGAACHAGILLWPYLLGSEDAPATAKRGDEKKSLSAASISVSRCWFLVMGIEGS